MMHTFNSGKYKGKNVAQVALSSFSGYQHLKDILGHWRGSSHKMVRDISFTLNQLNNFVPVVNCGDCAQPAEKIHTPYEWCKNNYSGNSYMDFELPSSEYYCTSHSKESRSNIHVARINFESISNYNNKKQAFDFFLSRLLGFSGEKNAVNCEAFIVNLRQKRAYSPSSIQTVGITNLPKSAQVQTVKKPKQKQMESQLKLFD